MIFLIFLLFSIQCIFAQEPSCSYFESSFIGYSCILLINNPNGFDNFTQIGGLHMDNRSDSDVIYIITSSSANSPIFPSIVCQQFPNTQIMHLDFLGLERIGDEAFRSCENLIELEFFGNPIMEISENALAENRNLQVFLLTYSLLDTLSITLFANQQSLLVLVLEDNQFETLSDGIFDTLTNLQQLYLYNNRLTTLPDGIFKELVNAEIISLNSNQITSLIPSWFENLPKLGFLALLNNQITSLPANIFNNMTNLQLLALSQNNLTTIHSNSFGSLPNLTEIYISNNQLDSIDERLIDNTGINFIETGGNPCDTTNGWISDNTPSRDIIRAALQQCFDNFEDNLCEIGNLDERICRLEEEVRELRELIREIRNK